MQQNADEIKCQYKVVINHEDQYSIWPDNQENPPGWQDAGRRGTKEECLDYIEKTWVDMRPRGLQKQ
jgi:MbtH protein